MSSFVNSGDSLTVRGRAGLFLPRQYHRKFDGVTAPALPAGWMATNPNIGDGILWTTSTVTPDSATNHAFVADQDGVSDKVLDTRPIIITSGTARLSFRNNYDMETDPFGDYDGGVLEVSSPNINGGVYTDILNPAVGGSFVTGGYNVTLFEAPGRSSLRPNGLGPLFRRLHQHGGKSGPNVNGQTIKLRFRMGTGSGRIRSWLADR